jgi:hypothetical protein
MLLYLQRREASHQDWSEPQQGGDIARHYYDEVFSQATAMQG